MPIVAFGTPAWVDDIADLIEERVAAAGGLARDRVFTYFGRPEDLLGHAPAEQFAAVGGPSLPVDPARVAGGGAAHTAFDGRFPVHLFARLATDRQFEDAKWLRSKSRGMGRLVHRVCKALQVYDAASAGASPLREPMRVLGVTFAGRGLPGGWGMATIEVSARFRTDFTA